LRKPLDRANRNSGSAIKEPRSAGATPPDLIIRFILRGRRLAVEHILAMLAAGDSAETLLEGYPWLELEDIQAFLLYARTVIGHERAEYGKQVIEQLSTKLTRNYGRGFSTTNLRHFRTFYTVYSDRIPEIRHITSGEFKGQGKRHTQSGVLDAMAFAVIQIGAERGFSHTLRPPSSLSPALLWVLMLQFCGKYVQYRCEI
jgi:uncharacterized protein (DUF433 family)